MQLSKHPPYSFVFMLLLLMLIPAVVGDWQSAPLAASGVLYLVFGLFCSLTSGPIRHQCYIHRPLFYIPLWPVVLVIGLFRFMQIVWRVNQVRR